MANGIEKEVTLTRMDEPIDKSSLGPNEYRVTEHWKVYGLTTKPSRREMQRYREAIDALGDTSERELTKIVMCYK